MKKILSAILMIAMLATMMSVPAFASETDVAQIGETGYATLKEAVDAAEDGATVKLLMNTSGDGMKIQKNITIDFGGYMYTVTSAVGSTGTETNGFQLLAAKDDRKPYSVTFKNGIINVSNENIKMVIQNYCNLTLEDMVVDGNGSSVMEYVVSNNNGTTSFNGQTSIAAPEGAVAFDVYYWPNGGYGDVSVTVETTGNIVGKIVYSHDATVDDATAAEHSYIKVIKGSFTDLASAVKFAKDGATVKLAADVTGEGMKIDKAITVDFGGHTYTVNSAVGSTGTETNGFQILADASQNARNVTFKNGTIKVVDADEVTSENPVKFLIQNYCNLTLNNMTVDGTGSSVMKYVVSNNNGATKFIGNTNITAPAGAKAFDVYDYKENGYKGVSVSVETTGKITGIIEVDSRDNADATLTISSGTFTSEIKAEWVADGCTSMKNADGTYAVGKGASNENFTLTVDGGYHSDAKGETSDDYDIVFNVNSPYELKEGEHYGMFIYIPNATRGLQIENFDDELFNTVITGVPANAVLVVELYIYNSETILNYMTPFTITAGDFTKWLGK